MANFSASARLRAELSGKYPPATPSPHAAHPWTEADHARARTHREALDRLTYPRRWQVTVVAADGATRFFFFVGALEQVHARALAIFGTHTQIVALEPAATGGAETYDSRLSLTQEK